MKFFLTIFLLISTAWSVKGLKLSPKLKIQKSYSSDFVIPFPKDKMRQRRYKGFLRVSSMEDDYDTVFRRAFITNATTAIIMSIPSLAVLITLIVYLSGITNARLDKKDFIYHFKLGIYLIQSGIFYPR